MAAAGGAAASFLTYECAFPTISLTVLSILPATACSLRRVDSNMLQLYLHSQIALVPDEVALPKASFLGEAVLPVAHHVGCCGASVGDADVPSVFHAATGHYPIPLIQHAQTPLLLLVTKAGKKIHLYLWFLEMCTRGGKNTNWVGCG